MIYPSAKVALLNGDIDLSNNTIKLALVTNDYEPSDAHDFFNDITNEVETDGYTAGGEEVDNQSVTLDTTTGKFTFDPVVWNITGGITYQKAILYVEGETAGESPLIACYEFLDGEEDPEDQVLAGNGTVTITPHASGALRAS